MHYRSEMTQHYLRIERKDVYESFHRVNLYFNLIILQHLCNPTYTFLLFKTYEWLYRNEKRVEEGQHGTGV